LDLLARQGQLVRHQPWLDLLAHRVRKATTGRLDLKAYKVNKVYKAKLGQLVRKATLDQLALLVRRVT
jgi:hypothetical protein